MRAELTNACTNDILRVGAGRSASQVSTSTSLLSSPEVRKVMDDNSVELYPGVPTAPVFEWHTPDDVLIPIDSVVNTISRYLRAAGATIQSQLFPSPDHLTTAVLGLPHRIRVPTGPIRRSAGPAFVLNVSGVTYRAGAAHGQLGVPVASLIV